MLIGNLLLVAVLAGSPDVEALRRELDAVADRIEQLKARRLAGESVEGELEPLLVRSQEIAEELERARPEPPAAPSGTAPGDADRERADELRDQAAALRLQAQHLAGALTALEARIAAALRAATASPAAPTGDPSLPRATFASTLPGDGESPDAAARTAIAALVQQRGRLEAHVRALRTEAAKLEAEANAIDER